jgi:hypothetical protein
MNAHNTTISYILNCNSNIQIGDASQVFYITLYTNKSTQEEDSKKQLQIRRVVIKRIKRVLDEKINIQVHQIVTVKTPQQMLYHKHE